MNDIGLQKSDLIQPRISLKAANTTGMVILGVVFEEIVVSQKGKSVSSKQLWYVTEGLDHLLLSRECCQSLGLLPESFPEVLCSTMSRMEVVTPSDFQLETPSQCKIAETLLVHAHTP